VLEFGPLSFKMSQCILKSSSFDMFMLSTRTETIISPVEFCTSGVSSLLATFPIWNWTDKLFCTTCASPITRFDPFLRISGGFCWVWQSISSFWLEMLFSLWFAAEGLTFGNSVYWVRFDEEFSDKVSLSSWSLRHL